MKKRIKSLFMGMCASLLMLALVTFFNLALKEPLAQFTQQLEQESQPPLTTQPTATPAVLGDTIASQSAELARVKRVVDGDTVELEDGRKLRYIGIDTPESVKPNTPEQCFSKASAARNKELVEGKEVRLIKDVSEKDRFQRLLRYVYVDDIFVNEAMVKEGYAFARSYPPDIAKQDLLRQAQAQAHAQNAGFWGSCEIVPKGNKGEFMIGN